MWIDWGECEVKEISIASDFWWKKFVFLCFFSSSSRSNRRSVSRLEKNLKKKFLGEEEETSKRKIWCCSQAKWKESRETMDYLLIAVNNAA